MKVYILEVEECNSYSYSGTLSRVEAVFASEKEAHTAGIQKVKEGYEGYSVYAYDIQGDLSVLKNMLT